MMFMLSMLMAIMMAMTFELISKISGLYHKKADISIDNSVDVHLVVDDALFDACVDVYDALFDVPFDVHFVHIDVPHDGFS